MIRASRILLYLGLGLATQTIGYGDMTFRAMVSADANVSIWAHILAWPLFLILLGEYYVLWFLGVLFGISMIFVAYLAIDEWIGVRRRRIARAKLARRRA